MKIILSITLKLFLLISSLLLDEYSSNSKEDISKNNFNNVKKVKLRIEIDSKPKHKNLTLEAFGAKGDGKTDDTKAITKALNSQETIIYAKKTKGFYRITATITINNLNNKILISNGAKFLNTDLTKATFLFQNSKNIRIQGGTFGYLNTPTKNGGNSQHVLQFEKCRNVVIDKIHIINSPEMGIAITNSDRVSVTNSIIENTFRDGTYAHYSSNVKYINNIYKNIKDDAMSFHDYGIDSEKTELFNYGYKQSTNLLAQNNTIKNAYQGIGSIGSKNIKLLNNHITNTVIAGIAIFNSQLLYPDGTSLVNDVQIIGNDIVNACSTVMINNQPYSNNGQASTGRAAIFIGSLGANNQVNAGENKRLRNIIISKNKITNSKANGFWCNLTDNLQFTNNIFVNCSGPVPEKSLAGDVIEINNVTTFLGNQNSVIDNRIHLQHQHAYTFYNVTGKMANWNVKGVAVSESHFTDARPQKIIIKSRAK